MNFKHYIESLHISEVFVEKVDQRSPRLHHLWTHQITSACRSVYAKIIGLELTAEWAIFSAGSSSISKDPITWELGNKLLIFVSSHLWNWFFTLLSLSSACWGAKHLFRSFLSFVILDHSTAADCLRKMHLATSFQFFFESLPNHSDTHLHKAYHFHSASCAALSPAAQKIRHRFCSKDVL